MQADVADRDASDLHRLELGDRRERTALADVHLDALHGRRRLARRELEGDRPARMVRGRAQPPLQLQRVHLHDHAVGVVAEGITIRLQPRAGRDHRVDRLGAHRARVGAEAGGAQRLQRLPVAGERQARRPREVIEEGVERTAGGHGGVLLAHGAGGGVARVGERRLAGLLQPAIQPLELVARHVDLAAHLQLVDGGQRARLEPHRHAADRAEVGADVLAHPPVAAGGAAHEAAARVEQRHAEPVDLGLADVAGALARQRPAQPGLELAQAVGRGGVVEREHRHAMLDGLEGVDWRARHALGRAVGRDEVGVLGLQGLELAQEGVVLGVGDLRPRLDVIEIVVVVDPLAQLGEPLGGVGARHDVQDNRALVRRERSGLRRRGAAAGEADRAAGHPARAVPAEVLQLHGMSASIVDERARPIQVPPAPARQRADHDPQLAAALGQLVAGAGRVIGVEVARHQPVLLHQLEPVGQDVRRDAGLTAGEVLEPLRPVEQIAHEQERPAVADDLEGPGDRTGLTVPLGHAPRIPGS